MQSPWFASVNALTPHLCGARQMPILHLTVDSGNTSASSDNPQHFDGINSELWCIEEGRVQQLNDHLRQGWRG